MQSNGSIGGNQPMNTAVQGTPINDMSTINGQTNKILMVSRGIHSRLQSLAEFLDPSPGADSKKPERSDEYPRFRNYTSMELLEESEEFLNRIENTMGLPTKQSSGNIFPQTQNNTTPSISVDEIRAIVRKELTNRMIAQSQAARHASKKGESQSAKTPTKAPAKAAAKTATKAAPKKAAPAKKAPAKKAPAKKAA